MNRFFKWIADMTVYGALGLTSESPWGAGLNFFIEDTLKIFTLVVVMIYLIALPRAGLDLNRVRTALSGKKRFVGYFLAACFGAITPFCSCSSIPLFLGFTSAGIPLGITMAFLITSPMINEVAVVLLGGLLGGKLTLLYVGIGLGAGILGGAFFDLIKADRFLTDLGRRAWDSDGSALPVAGEARRLTMKDRHIFAVSEVRAILGRIWKWILIGVGLGAVLHGFVPESFLEKTLGDRSWWSVPAVVLLGIPLYSGASGVIPVAETLLAKGVPVGTVIAFMMSTVAASFPEFILLKQVMKPRLLVTFFLLLLVLFTITGWFLNLV